MTDINVPTVRIIYTHFPHYRQPVFDSLSNSCKFNYEFYFDSAGIEKTIKSGTFGNSKFHDLKTRRFGPFFWQSQSLLLALKPETAALIFLGNPFILSTWLAAIIARVRGTRVLFWTHGWVRDKRDAKDGLRGLFYRLAHGLLLYGERARRLGIERGFHPKMLHVIGNSLDYERQALLRDRLLANSVSAPERHRDKPFFLVVSRLVESAEIDVAIEAVATMDGSAALVVIGHGPSRSKLEALASANGVDVRFEGALYSEEELAPYFLNCVAVVSPGKVGLLAMHALAYGAAVITHGDPDRQMPEFEAIQEGLTGAFFEYGNANNLAALLQAALDQPLTTKSLKARREAAIAVMENGYTPQRQVELIEAALLSLGVGVDG